MEQKHTNLVEFSGLGKVLQLIRIVTPTMR